MLCVEKQRDSPPCLFPVGWLILPGYRCIFAPSILRAWGIWLTEWLRLHSRVPGVPGHMVVDAEARRLYINDPATGRVLRVHTDSGKFLRDAKCINDLCYEQVRLRVLVCNAGVHGADTVPCDSLHAHPDRDNVLLIHDMLQYGVA